MTNKECAFWILFCVIITLWGIFGARADCTGCAPGKGYEHLFTADGKPIAKAIPPRKHKWSKHK